MWFQCLFTFVLLSAIFFSNPLADFLVISLAHAIGRDFQSQKTVKNSKEKFADDAEYRSSCLPKMPGPRFFWLSFETNQIHPFSVNKHLLSLCISWNSSIFEFYSWIIWSGVIWPTEPSLSSFDNRTCRIQGDLTLLCQKSSTNICPRKFTTIGYFGTLSNLFVQFPTNFLWHDVSSQTIRIFERFKSCH